MTLQTQMSLSNSPIIGKGLLAGAPATDERGFPSVVHGQVNVGATSQFHPTRRDLENLSAHWDD
jgi:hypothetical protein